MNWEFEHIEQQKIGKCPVKLTVAHMHNSSTADTAMLIHVYRVASLRLYL